MFTVLHIADFPLQAVLRTEPISESPLAAAPAGPAGRPTFSHLPAALFSGTHKKSVVLAANPTARARGVELGMSAPQAVARCPRLVIRSPQPAAEAEARAALLAVGFTLSPLLEDTAPGLCTADISGLDPAQLLPLAQTALTELARLGLPATAGIARTPLLALYAARAAVAGSPAGPPSALRNPQFPLSAPALLAVSADSEARFLAPLPLAAADPAPELAAVLHGWGLRTFGDLTALPRDEIVRRFGAEGLALWTRASGGAARPLHPVKAPQEFVAALELEQELETLEPLLFILRRFLDRLTLELRASQHVAIEAELTLQLEDEAVHARSFRLPEPTADVEILFRTLHTHLESLSTAAAIVAVRLRLTPARPLVRQQGIFETGLRDPHGFAETLARVSALVGADRLGTPRMADTHRPDAIALTTPTAVIPSPAAPPLHAPLGLPLRRFRPPLPARLEFTAGRPTFLWTDQVRGEITHHSAPYLSSGDWWQPDRSWSRIEWDIALVPGGLYRLLQVGENYFLEGEYD